MKRRYKQLLIIALVILLTTAVVSWPAVVRYLIQSSLQQARKGGHQLSWSGLATGMNSASFKNLTLWIPGPKVKGKFHIPVSLDLQDLAVALNVGSFLVLRPSVIYETSLYGGVLKGTALHAKDGEEITARIDGVEIGKHPQIASLGVRGGTITASLEQLFVTPKGPSGGSFSIAIGQLFPPLEGTAKTLLRVTELGPFDLNATGRISPQSIQLPDINLSSQFGKANGSLTVLNHLSGSPNLSGNLRITLSEQGLATVGPWLPLIPGAGLNSSSRQFSVRVNSIPCGNVRGDTSVINIGTGCVKLSYTQN